MRTTSYSSLFIAAVRKAAFVILAMLALAAAPLAAQAKPLTITLLGTGSPAPNATRFSQSILIEAGSSKYLIDLGRGVTIRLAQLRIPMGKITASFITHSHSDHLNGLADFWMTGWIGTGYGGRTTPMVLYGPKGTEAMAKHLEMAFSENTRIRHADEKEPLSGIEIDAHDIKGGFSYEHDGIKITAFDTHHGDLIKPNFGYIIEYDGKKAVISGDTTYDERVAKAAKGADLLLHEVAYITPELMEKKPIFKAVAAHHTSPEEAGRIFAEARPTLAAFTHLVIRLSGEQLDLPASNILLEQVGKTYDGPVVVGEDLMRFTIGDKAIIVNGDKGQYGFRVPNKH
ncbi:MAG TPA: MBL fold metallo-hydrolase [Eoetvoesiella sp.]|uniref:MBL fold metallo-hydrolase n=1 Tax=Eoetvoesiella sp. TaxID=1966355 RepID=UPI002C32243A|nr:MBL fold metallo-hydrolase [Eoetvoesiella sp.]HWK61755.1 MBL fold metallo-hydrolase [Eoetvoesiella sp.]